MKPAKPKYRYFVGEAHDASYAWRTDGKTVEARCRALPHLTKWFVSGFSPAHLTGSKTMREVQSDPFETAAAKPAPTYRYFEGIKHWSDFVWRTDGEKIEFAHCGDPPLTWRPASFSLKGVLDNSREIDHDPFATKKKRKPAKKPKKKPTPKKSR